MNDIYLSLDLQEKMQAILNGSPKKLSELASIAGLRLDRDYVGADLSGEDLTGDNLSEVNFQDANLSQADFRNTKLIKANFFGADLTGAILQKTKLELANFRGAKINKTTQISEKWRLVWELANKRKTTKDLEKKDLTFANLSFTDLSKAHLSHTLLHGALLEEANMESADLRYANLRLANLKGANLTRANIDETTDFSEANVEGMKLGGNFGMPKEIREKLIKRGAIIVNCELPESLFSAIQRSPKEQAALIALERERLNTLEIELEKV